MKAVFFLLVGLLLASAVVAGPLGSWQSVDEVEECSDLTRFKEGYIYTFSYEAVTETGIKGAGPGSTMTMTCNVQIEAPERCRNVLKTTSCRLDESPEFALEMSAHDLVFRTDKGRIVEVLAHPDEPMNILNTKRGILSLLQLDVEADDAEKSTINEVSVHGNCSSEVSVTRRDNKDRPRKIEMVTDLNSCLLRKRPENMTRWQSLKDVLLNTTVVDKFINSTKMCNYDLKGTSGEIKGVECSEVHSFWPMNFNSESGVRTSIEQTLINTDVTRLNSFKVDPANTRSTCLRFEHDPKEIGKKAADVTADQAINILKALVKSSRNEVQMESPRLFGRWRAALEGMDNTTIHEVFDRAYDCSEYSQTCRDNPDKSKLAREYLLDGLLPCTTMACFSVKNYAIAKGVVPKPLANAWMVTMALQNYPTLEVMSEMLRMAQSVPSQITIFPLSIMIHNYWMNNPEIHTSNSLPEPMANTIRYLKSLIGSDCSVPAENERLALVALKAIGNIGEPVERYDQLTFSYSEKVSPALISCSKNKQIPSDISKAAVQSMRRFVLSDQLRRQVIDELFKETSLGVSQRIAAYLIAMKGNPSVSELTGIWTFLKTEPVNQMKAFCYSHIKNVIESSEPTLQELKSNLKKAMIEEQLPEYPKDIRKFSRYLELSKNLTEPWRNNTVAVQFESDIIYKPESYMPQEVMFHYVLNALGKSWDLFETGVEMKGFEPILESVFGPEGFFPEVSLQALFENIDENILTKVREFAEVQLENWVTPTPEQTNNPIFNKKDKYSKKIKRQATGNQEIVDIIHENTMNKLTQLHNLVGMKSSATDATVFLRLLGNEFGFLSASDVLAVIPYTMGIFEEFVNKTKQIPQLLSQGLNLNTTRSLVFMDKSFIVPTGMGMPLNCSINGTAVVSMRVRSQFSINLPRIIAAGHIAPSGAVEILATMGIGMPSKVFTGVMANSTIYHSSKIEGNITIDGTRLRINLNNTDRPMNLFNYSTTYNLLKANGDVEFIPGVLQDAVKSQRCTNVSKVFGVDLCVSWAYPNASYVPEAPRFPFAGPNSFNVTLVNTDKALKAYTFDAQYKQIKEGGAPMPISFGSIGKRSKRNTQPITKLVDTVRVSFYAPGEELTRNITSFLSVDRLRKTAKWTLTVPEVKNFIMFAGILNETTDSAASYRAVFNMSAADQAVSVDFLVKNETSMAQKNLTAVFNASINDLYWAAVGQFVKQSPSGNWNAHVTDTYYWDNETPLYTQILFPWTGYQINHEKYHTSSISVERRARGDVVERNLNMATLGWAFDFNTRQEVTDTLKELTFHTQISNATWALTLLDVGLRNVTTELGYRLEGEISRNTHHVFAEYDVTKQPGQTNRNFRTGLRTDVFVDNPDVAMFMSSPVLLKLFGETALIDEPVVIAGGVNFTILDQSALTTEHLVQTSIYVPNPRNPTTHLTYDFDLRVENATILNKKEYSLELSTPMPFLKMTNINLVHLMIDTEAGTSTVEHFYTLFDTRYNKAQTIVSNSISAGWKKPSANWFMNVETPSLSYHQNYTALYSRENGLQYFYETSQDSSFSDLLDFTEINNISLKPTAVSTYWSYIHKLVTSNISNNLNLDGPITEMRPLLVPMIVRDVLNKTIRRDFSGVKDIILNKFVYNVTGSSLTLRQSVNVTSPVIANLSASHYFFLSRDLVDHRLSLSAAQERLNISAGLNHSLVIENRDLTVKTEGSLIMCSGLQMITLTSINATLLKSTTPFDLAALHDTRITSPLMQFSTVSSVNSNVGDNSKLNMVANHNTALSSRLVSLDVVGNYNIDDMSSATYFNDMTGALSYKLVSRMVKSSFNSTISFNTFRKLFKFNKVQAKASHDIKSSIITWNAQGQTLLQHFSKITQFGEVSSSIEANLLTKIVDASHSSALALKGMDGLVQFNELTGHLRNNLTSKFVNSTYETEIEFNNVESLVSFNKLGGSSNYVLSSRLMNVTANNTLELNRFRTVFNFDGITGNQIWFVNTRLMNATMNNDMALTGFRSLFSFDEITGRVSADFTSCIANGNTHNTLLIQNVESLTSVAKFAVETTSNFTSRPVNINFSDNMVISNHRSLLNFDSITSTMNFTSKVFNVSTSALNEVNFNGFESLFVFAGVSHSLSMAAKSYYLNTTMTEMISLQNFTKINQFNLASAEVVSSFNTFPLMVSYQQTHKVEEMTGWFQYPLAETVIMGNITTAKLNLSSSYEGRIVNMRAPFNYDGSIAKVEYSVNNRLVNVTGIHGVEVNNMRSVFSFNKINGTSSHMVDTPVTHMAVGGLLEMINFQSLFNFDLVNMTTSNMFSVTPLTTTFASYNAGLALRGFEKFNRFNSIHGFSRTAALTKWTNWAMNMESELSGFRSFLNFDSIMVAGQNEFTSPLFVTFANTTSNVIGSTGFFKASAANSRNMFSISSRIAKVDTGAIWSVNDLTSPLSFSANNINTYLNVSTILGNTGSVLDIQMNEWQNVTHFGMFEVNAANDILSRIAKWNVLSHFKLDNMAGILTYSRVEGSASSNLTSIISSLNTSIDAHINGQSGFLTYDEMVVSTKAYFSSWPVKMQGATELNIQNMAGFMMFDSISSSASSNLTSRFFNATSQTSLLANVGTGLFKVGLANVTGSFSVETPITRGIKASSSAQITNSREIFNFDEASMLSEVSFLTAKINITGNVQSTLTNFVNITQFESSESSANMIVTSRFFNSSSSGLMQLRGFQRLFRFEQVKIGGFSAIKSVLANVTTEAGIDFANFQRIFTFERVNSSAGVAVTSKLATLEVETGMEMTNFNGPTTFERFNGSFISNLNSTFINSTTAAGYTLQGFRSLFNFVKVEASAESVLNNKWMNATAMADYTISDSSCFCRFAQLVARSAGSFTTKIATGNAVGSVELQNVRNLTSFDLFNITGAARFNSKPVTALTEGVYSVTNQQWLYKFDDTTSRLYGNVRSKWLNATAMMESQMNNSRSLLGFEAAKSQGSFILRTPVSQAHFHAHLNLIEFTNITHYAETSAMVAANITSPFLNARAYTRFNVSKMAGIMTFDKFLTDSFANVQSRFVNTTLQNSVVLTGFRGISYSAIGHRFNFLWADPINELSVKNGFDMTTLQDMAQLFNITWVNPKGTVFISQSVNYENLIASIKVPSIGVITAGANLNTVGDILRFYIDHQLMRDNLKTVNDITWFLRLNQSNVIYSNFSWNPETVSEIVDITVGAINSTFNRTITIANSTINRIMEVANRTLTRTRKMTNCTKCFMRYTMMVANETLTASLSQLNQTFYNQLVEFNQTFYNQLVEFNQTFYTQLKKLNQTLFTQLDRLNQTIIFARNNPREFISKYVNLTRLNETVIQLNETLREVYTKLRYNITHPRETLENIKILIKYDQRREKITWLVENRDMVKTNVIEYLKELKANMTIRAKEAIADLKEVIQYDAKVEAIKQYVETRFNVPKIQQKIRETTRDLTLKLDEIKQKMSELKVTAGEKLIVLKTQIAALEKETVKAEIKARIEMIKNFIVYYLNSTTLDAIERSIFINYTDDSQVQDLMRKVIRIRPRNIIDIIDMDSVMEAKENVMVAKEKVVERLEMLNQTTFRYVNKTFLNETAKQTLEMLREWNATFNEYVYVDVIKGDIKLVLNITKEKVANLTKVVINFMRAKAQIIKAVLKEKWDARPKSLEELKERLMEIKVIVRDYLVERYDIDIDLVAQNMIDEYMQRREQMDLAIARIIEISKNETHPLNMLPLCYFNRTIFQIVQPPVNMTMNLTVVYSKMALNFTKVYSKEAVNFTKVYSRIAMEKGIALSKKYLPVVKKALKEYKVIAVEKSKVLKEKAVMYFQMAKGNATIYYQKYAPIVNQTIRQYTCIAKQAMFNYTVMVRNVTDTYINMTIELLEPHVQPYRDVVMQKVETLRMRAAEMKERVRNLPAQTEEFLMATAEYHIDRYPEYKQMTIQKIEDLKVKIAELKVNLTNLYTEVKVNLTRLYGELKQNATEAYFHYSQKAQELYTTSKTKFSEYKTKAQQQWQTIKPIIVNKTVEILDATKRRVNQTVEVIIFTTKDEFSLINELPMRAMEKTIFELTMELKELMQQIAESTKMNIQQFVENTKMSIRNRNSLINKYPVMYLNMTVFEAGNLSYSKMLVASNLTKFYANRTMCWANTSLVAANKTVYEVLILTNKTVREVIIPYVNQTTRDLIVFLNRTRFQPWDTTLNETLSFLNKNSVVLMNKANETFILVQTRAIEAWRNLTSEESIAQMKIYLNKTRGLIINYARVANETIYMLRNKSMNLIIYVRDETRLLNLTREYVLLAKNFTRNSISKARNISQETIYLARNMTNSITTYINGPAKEFAMEYVTYINNTMPGWMIRYYEVDQVPAMVRTFVSALEPVELARNLTAYAINRTIFMTELALNRSEALTRYAFNQTRVMTQVAFNKTCVMTQFAFNKTCVMTQFALNQTRVLTKQAINRTRTFIRDTLNTIGRLDDHSFAMNISHPFNWTSFRSSPRLSNSQIQFIKDKVNQLNSTVVIPFMYKVEELRYNLTERYNNISMMVMEFYELKKPIVEEKIEEFRMKMLEKIDEYRQLLNEYKQLMQEKWETEWKPTLLEKKEEVMSKWENEIKPKIDEMVSDLKTFVKDPELLAKLKEKTRYIKNEYLPELKRFLLEEKYPELKRIILDEKYPEMKMQVLAQYEVAKEIFEEFKQNITLFREQMVFKIQKMKVQAEEKWAEMLEKIQDIKQNWPETYKKLKADILDVKIQMKAKLSEFINKVLSILRELRIPVEALPLEHINLYTPWTYTAMIFGENHVMTFDGKVYSVPIYANEQQTYVLAHDFIDRNFTLLGQKGRVTLLVRNLSVAIDDQNVVYINGLPTMQELPYQTPISKELTIMHKGPWVNVTTTKGIALSCHSDHFLCIFHLSGWYHGKSRGLLGNLDTEHHNEFILPEGVIASDLASFITAYDVSPFNMPRGVIPSRLGSCSSDFEKCSAMFLDVNSMLNGTFSFINPREFYNFCVEQTRRCQQSCEATNPVVTLGKEMNANVEYDPECLDCNIGDLTLENGRSSADIIFVISETAAMAEDNIIKSSLKTIINRIKGKLNAFNVTGVKYGIAAFSGSDIHGRPHTHTLCGHILDNSIDCAESGVDSLVFEGVKPTDAMQAIQLAAHYPFRKDSAKIIILINDEDLNEDGTKPWDYLFNINTSLQAMQHLLVRQGITFNVFSSYPTLNKKTSESPILGVNYLGKQIIKKKNSGEEGIDRLAIPKGQYAKLAKATRGSIMGLHWLQSGHRDLNFMFPRMLWKQIQPQFSGQVDFNCRCVLGVYGQARTECQMSRFVDGMF